MLGWALFVAVLALGCGPRFELEVHFAGRVEIEPGAPVVYQGVEIGEVLETTLSQASPSSPAEVTLRLGITNQEVTLRQNDVFEVVSGGLLSARIVRITPFVGESPPLEPGARVAGVPPLVTRVSDSLAEAVDSVSQLAAEKAQEALEALAESLEELTIPEPGDSTEAPTPPLPHL